MGQKQTTTTTSSIVSQRDKITSNYKSLKSVNKNSFEFLYVVGKGGFGKVPTA